MMIRGLLPLCAGLLFAVGLAISGMTQPAKIVGFLDLFGHWDPSLAFVMAGAVSVYAAVHRGLVVRRKKPLYADRFVIPTRSGLDARLLVGAAIFGVGWALSGFCPGPALVSFGANARAALWFVPAAAVGMILHHRFFHEANNGDG